MGCKGCEIHRTLSPGNFQDSCAGENRAADDKPVGAEFEDKEEDWHESRERKAIGSKVRYGIQHTLAFVIFKIIFAENVTFMEYLMERLWVKNFSGALIGYNQTLIDNLNTHEQPDLKYYASNKRWSKTLFEGRSYQNKRVLIPKIQGDQK